MLARTREKLTALETRVAALEAKPRTRRLNPPLLTGKAASTA